MSEYKTITPSDTPNYRDTISHVSEQVWPEFMFHDPISDEHWDGLFDHFPDFQFALLDEATGEVAGIGNSVPLNWQGALDDLPDEGWDWAMIKSARDYNEGVIPNLLCGIQIAIPPNFQGRGLSKILLGEMIAVARSKGLPTIIIPVRPSMKAQYPLTDINRYIQWKTDEDLPFDPWLRVHVRNGGSILKPCTLAMRIPGTIADWEEWTDMRFFESGEYIVPGALSPVDIDVDADLGVYIEPNVWVIHNVA